MQYLTREQAATAVGEHNVARIDSLKERDYTYETDDNLRIIYSQSINIGGNNPARLKRFISLPIQGNDDSTLEGYQVDYR